MPDHCTRLLLCPQLLVRPLRSKLLCNRQSLDLAGYEASMLAFVAATNSLCSAALPRAA